jgi:LacI family transcriptional regulator
MVTIKQISDYCGISVTQVSRALNGHSDVKESTRQIVLVAAEKLGYVKNIYATRLANQTSNQIAVIIEGVESGVTDESSGNLFKLLQGINNASAKLDFEPLIYLKNTSKPVDYVTFCTQRYISGVIVFGSDYNNPQLTALHNSSIPCVTIDISVEGKNNGCVIVNDTYYSNLAVSHLIEKGCKKIAVLCGFKDSFVTMQRLSGYTVALNTNKLSFDEKLVRYCNFDTETAKEETMSLLTQYMDIDGFFCMSDQLAFGCIETIKNMGLSIPENIKVFGFDGLYISTLFQPPLSTIAQDFYNKGEEAAKLLHSIINNSDIKRTVVIPCEMIIRKSTNGSFCPK